MTEQFDYEAFKQAAIKGLYEGKPLTGEQGLFAPLLKNFLEAALEGEMDNHLAASMLTKPNRRNGKNTKTVKSSAGLLELTTPRDRTGSYQPQIVPKRQLVLTDQLKLKYSHSMAGDAATPISVSIYRRGTATRCQTAS